MTLRGLSAVFAIVLSMALSLPAQAAETIVFPIYSRTLFFLPVWLAAGQGYFADEGLNVTLPAGATQDEVASRLRSGDLGIHIVGPETVFADADDVLRVVAGNAGRLPHFIIAQPRFKTVADLKHANFGVISAHEGTTHLIPEIMQSVGVGPGDYTLSPVGSANVRWTLLKAGRIDAGLQPFPLSYEAEAAGFSNLGWTGRYEPDWQFTAIVVNRRWAEAHREAVAGFLRAVRRGTQFMIDHRDEAAEVAARELGTSTAHARRAIDDALRLGILDPSLAINDAGMRRVFAVSPRPDGAGEYRPSRYVDESFLLLSQHARRIRFVTGPFRATEAETRRLWAPLFDYLAAQLGMEAELTIESDWAEVGRGMVAGRHDVAWMGGAWRYVLARSEGAGPAIATVAFNGSPTYHAVVVERPGLAVTDYPADAKGLSLSFTHDASSTGWLAPYAWLVERGIDPKTYFRYSATAEHPQNETRVAAGQVDLATDNDNNRNAMIARGAIKAEDARIVWTSPPVPQDPIAVRAGLDPALAQRLQAILSQIDAERARSIPMPPGYTGFVAATDASYAAMRQAGIATGRISPKRP